MDLDKLTTEKRNEKSMGLDEYSTREILQLMNAEDEVVPKAIAKNLASIESATKKIIDTFNKGGKLFYIGAGTSGRLGILDAVECVPTFGTDPKMVQGIIAGGETAMMKAVEGAEDDLQLAEKDLIGRGITAKDTVVGIAASGRTPYVIGGLRFARNLGANTVSLSCNRHAEISKEAEIVIEVEVGAEILTGSTRLKSGTAQKLVLNMLSTSAMIGIGKVYNNLMVDVQPSNEKLRVRAIRIIRQSTDCSEEIAQKAYKEAELNVKVAIVMILCSISAEEAKKRLLASHGFIKDTF
ncbi:N-acetylmuramic acid 6-phosphate etherase [Kurthia sibirica]|uniref:N-acetylmuramic acid 6-phosphate etherase n=1 Tax=Kurthia sibirica TaxID=202750 RepID=A0A2U3ANL1_9BACL|nr:N-acetylmuramic acid 6-phosphate etherase [Kurthia sibirica]PWI26124.1 N-acetylmuramic acid 6-phosphate etherase [Kurthia sibirica]GEK33381.1 N-acetylmuramic acid 6-phosphate etherase 2 [Kurthia sibirica]